MLDWSPLVAFVHRHHRFLLTTHTRPDADGLGSVQAVAEALEALGKTVHRVVPSRIPPRYDFIDPQRKIEVFSNVDDRLLANDAIIVLDTGTWNQLAGVGDVLKAGRAEIAVIDHHRTQDDLGATKFVDVSAEATGRLAVEVIDALDLKLTPTMADNLFAALAMDTGWFRHSSTTPYTFALAGRLVAAGARPTPLYDELFEKNSLPRLLLTGRVLERLASRADGRVVWSDVYLSDYAETGAVPPDTEDLVNYPRSVMSCDIGLLFIEQRDGTVKVSFRARRSDVAKLAEQFGGGGHRLASGATLAGPLAVARELVLDAAVLALNDSSAERHETRDTRHE
jgi:phosphoesterase RecJ-like protein